MKKRNSKKPKIQGGARNLVILGVLSTMVAMATTGVALAIYHNSGDIYLDRSRPGYLPDEEEIEQEEQGPEEEDYDFTQNKRLTETEIDEFLEELQEEIDEINAYDKPFSEDALSDERLGIPTSEQTEEEKKSADGGEG